MEKYIHRIRIGFRTRFLKKKILKQSFIGIAAVFCTFLCAAADMRFSVPVSQLPAKTESSCSFVLEIPGTVPARVEAFFGQLPEGVRFTGFEKKPAPDGGTHLTYSVYFSAEGEIQLPAATVRIEDISYTVAFDAVQVSKNPESLVPEFFFSTDESVRAGEKLHIYLMGRFFRSVEAVHTELSEKALAEKAPTSPPFPVHMPENGSEPVKIAEFIYTPFFEGTHRFPATQVRTESFDGTIRDIQASPLVFDVLPAEKAAKDSAAAGAENISMPEIPNHFPHIPQSAAGTAADLVFRLAQLRNKERRSAAFLHFRRERKALEEQALLQNPDEVPLFWTVAAGVLFCILFPFVIVLSRRSKKIAFAVAVPHFLCAVVLVNTVPRAAERPLIAHRAVLRTIPEAQAQGSTAVADGTRLRVLRTNGEWYLVDTAGNRSGWVLKAECVPVCAEKKSREH